MVESRHEGEDVFHREFGEEGISRSRRCTPPRPLPRLRPGCNFRSDGTMPASIENGPAPPRFRISRENRDYSKPGSPFFLSSSLSGGESTRRIDEEEGVVVIERKGEVPCSPWPVLGGRSTPRQKFFEQGTTCPRKTRPACIDSGALPSSFVLFVSTSL